MITRKYLPRLCTTKQLTHGNSKKILATSGTNRSQSNTTVDKEDVEHHSRHMAVWWDSSERGPMKALHSLNSLRVPYIRDAVLENSQVNSICLKDKKILDVGCGGGILSEALARFGASVTGIDASEELIDTALNHASSNKRLARNKPNYLCTTVEEHSSNFNAYYDAVVASEVIEHVTDKELFVESCVQALKPGGKFIMTCPSRTRLTQLYFICIAEEVLNVIPKGTHEYEKFVTPDEMRILLEMCNCKVESANGLFYNFFSNKWKWITPESFHFALKAVKL